MDRLPLLVPLTRPTTTFAGERAMLTVSSSSTRTSPAVPRCGSARPSAVCLARPCEGDG